MRNACRNLKGVSTRSRRIILKWMLKKWVWVGVWGGSG
jgi:hypothetical protein